MFDQRERRELEKRMKEQDRLPPGQSATIKFPVLHYGPVPKTDLATWDFRIFGLVGDERRWTWQEFNQLPRTQIMLDIHCVTRWSKFNTVWEGVAVSTLIKEGLIRPQPEAKFVVQHCEYGYTTNTPIDFVVQEGFILATHYDGQPLTPDHGYPLRGVVGFIPGREDMETPYFWKGAKWLRSIEFMSRDKRGFWEQAGYHNRADAWREERFG